MKQKLEKYAVVGVVGFGLTGTAVVRFLLDQGVQPLVFDSREKPPGLASSEALLADCEYYFGEYDLAQVLMVDLLIVSPGIDIRTGIFKMALDAGVKIISEIELFAWYNNTAVLAITGSNGKSTVTSLLAHMLTQKGYQVGVGGNIGTPAIALLGQEFDYIVLELSSFQLEQTYSLAPAAAGILNVSADHLDRYDSESAYVLAKQRIYQNAEAVIWNKDDLATKPFDLTEVDSALRVKPIKQQSYTLSSKPRSIDFALQIKDSETWLTWQGEALIAAAELPLVGTHNYLNVLAALAFCRVIGIEPTAALKLIKGFTPLPHRCELFLETQGVRWIDDSKSTNPGSTLAAIEGLSAQGMGQLILIAGGDSKQIDLSPLAVALEQVDLLITLGKDGSQIAQLKTGAKEVDTLAEAAALAKEFATPGSLVLLSPACSSLDMFKNFEDRGRQFQQAVRALYEE